MSEVTPSAESDQSLIADFNHTKSTRGDTDVSTESRRISTRASMFTSTASNNAPKDFGGAAPRIGGVLALRNENVTKKVNYDVFCEKLGVHIMNEFKGGEMHLNSQEIIITHMK